MTTAAKVIEGALTHIGAHSPIRQAGPEVLQTAFDQLVYVLQEWEGEDFDIGATIPTAPGDELSEFPGAANALEHYLAISVAPKLQKPISRDLSNRTNQVVRLARERWQHLVPDRRPSRRYIGQGNKFWR